MPRPQPAPRLRRRVAALVALAVILIPSACARDDGRELVAPSHSGSTAPIVTTPASAAPTAGVTEDTPLASGPGGSTQLPFTLASPSMAADQVAARRYGCPPGEGISPPLAWTGIPAGTVELTLLVTDLDTPQRFVHWMVAGIPPTAPGLAEGLMVDGAVQAANSGGQPGWQPFCPPAGETHRYQFVLYALATPSGITEGMPTAAALEVFDQRTDPTAALSVLFNLDAAP